MLLSLPATFDRAASFEGIIVIAVIYAILTVVGKLKEAANRGKQQEPPRQPASRQPRIEYPGQRTSERQLRRPPPDTQSEAGKLEELLRGLGELAGLPDQGPMGRRSGSSLPSAEEAEERESLEVDQEAVSLEAPEPVRTRVEVDQDEGAEALVQRRIQAALDRNRPLSQADHRAFDQRIQGAVAPKVTVVKVGRSRIRDAIVWREILGPPIALREQREE